MRFELDREGNEDKMKGRLSERDRDTLKAIAVSVSGVFIKAAPNTQECRNVR